MLDMLVRYHSLLSHCDTLTSLDGSAFSTSRADSVTSFSDIDTTDFSGRLGLSAIMLILICFCRRFTSLIEPSVFSIVIFQSDSATQSSSAVVSFASDGTTVESPSIGLTVCGMSSSGGVDIAILAGDDSLLCGRASFKRGI